MKQELQNQLAERYPILFSDISVSASRSPISTYGIECGDGWFTLINSLCARVEPKVQDWKKENPEKEHPRLAQVKEKFGGLCFYMDSKNEEGINLIKELYSIILPSQNESFKICELCGASGKLIKGSYLRTLCKKCNKKE